MTSRSIKFLASALLVPALALSACGKKEEKAAAPTGPITAKAPPAGSKWSEQVVATPEGGMRMGNPEAPIKLVEYGSFTCSHCRDFAAESEEPLKHGLVETGKVSLEYRPYVRDPIDLSIGLLARCNGPEAFFPLAAQFFGNQEDMFKQIQSHSQDAIQGAMAAPPQERFGKLAAMANLIEFAKQRGLSEEKAKSCLADTKAAEALVKGTEAANGTYPIQGTPSFIMNGQLLESTSTWSALQAKLKEAGL